MFHPQPALSVGWAQSSDHNGADAVMGDGKLDS
jgi:hypothetical protein